LLPFKSRSSGFPQSTNGHCLTQHVRGEDMSEFRSTQENNEALIRERAYHLWELEGRQEGRASEYWHRAKEQLDSDTHAAYPPAASRGHRT
jgi:hypothetical protein